MNGVGVLLLSLLIGIFVGLRSLAPPAVTAWAARLYWIDLGRSRLSFVMATPAIAILTALALIELVADKLPSAPNRTTSPGLLVRTMLGAFCGGCIAAAGRQPVWLGAVLGLLGGLIGCFGGFHLRTRLVKALHCPDFVVAVLEDLVAIGGAFYVVTRF